MRTITRTLLLSMLAVVVISSAELSAQQDPNLTMMRRIYSKLTQMFTVGLQGDLSIDGFKPGSAVLILLNPGIFVDPSLDVTTPGGRLAVAQMLNRVPKVSWLYEDSGLSVSDVYERVMMDSEAVYREPTPAERAQLAAMETFLFLPNGDPTPKYQKYLDLRDRYGTALASCEEDRGNAPDCKASLRNAKNQARDRWETEGRKNEVEGNLQRYHQLTQSAAAWFRQLRERFQNAEETAEGIPFHRVLTYPSYPKWSDSQGWASYTLTDTELEMQTESSRVTYGGGGGVNFGLFSIGGSSFTSEGKTYARSKTNGISIDVDVKRVTLFRPWLNRVVFESDRWRFAPGGASGDLKLSNGKVSATEAPSGLMPLYPTGVLLARKVRINGLDTTDIQTHFDKQVETRGSVGWGPFRVGGHYSENQNKDYKFAKKVGNSIQFDDPQIIGIYAEVLREAPKPTTDPLLKWLSNPPVPQ